ncbi:Leucine Rich Repeat [Musa troglodytarum]|uniref:Leucine Rich Repeat n=1 Tax=Musa troglodytarum TaxID=320322 RepID=A0A9E7GA01_9LILI|nr:Leucine Rich Repeat [Musa troglodytarum]
MARLTLEQISHESKDGTATTSLNLSHRALSDVSCLSNFRNLERLDLNCNCLSSLEDLSSCVNLKWLSVVENKLETLKGVEGLSKLMVLNAGKNKLRAMNEIETITSLRALILNDNKISHICKLDQLGFLNTLVLSRNPIYDIGASLMKAKSITKLSLSHCQIQEIGSSLISCVDLKEAKFAHNKIGTLPADLAQNTRLQNLDMGSNLIENWSDIKVLSALHNLKNLNLQGNPIAEKDKLAKKVKKMVPRLRIFNTRPTETAAGAERLSHNKDANFLPYSSENEAATKLNKKRLKSDANVSKIVLQKSGNGDDNGPASTNVVEKETEKKKSKLRAKKAVAMDHNPPVDKKAKGKQHTDKEEEIKFEGIDDVETPFADLIFSKDTTQQVEGYKKGHEMVADGKLVGALVLNNAKRRKWSKNTSTDALALQLQPPASEVGMGGPSTWGD